MRFARGLARPFSASLPLVHGEARAPRSGRRARELHDKPGTWPLRDERAKIHYALTAQRVPRMTSRGVDRRAGHRMVVFCRSLQHSSGAELRFAVAITRLIWPILFLVRPMRSNASSSSRFRSSDPSRALGMRSPAGSGGSAQRISTTSDSQARFCCSLVAATVASRLSYARHNEASVLCAAPRLTCS
jgi:hypothetical protein